MIVVFGVTIALAAAARSTWSPCGLSMLSQITPLAEAGRGQRYARTAGWFVAGATLGGLSLGCAMAALALVVTGIGPSATTAIAVTAGCAFAAATVDARVLGFGPPFLRRQVNDHWLSTYRPWVYGGGFGWQIGAGFTTYVMTAAVPLVVVVAALCTNPWTALTVGGVFGLARGIAVLLGARLRTPAALYDFHRRFDAWTEPVRQIVIGIQLAVAVAAASIATPTPVAAVLSGAAIVLLARTHVRTARSATGPLTLFRARPTGVT